MSTIKEWLTPPHYEDAETNRVGRLLHFLLLSTICILIILLIAQFVSGLATWQTNITRVLGLFILILIGLWVSVRQGYVKIASYIFVFSGWIAVNYLD